MTTLSCFRDAVVFWRTLESRPSLEASDTTTAYDLFRDHRPDVAVIDLSMRNDDLRGLSLIRRVKAHDPRFPMVVLSMHRDPTVVLQALEAGALGYILKDNAAEDLLKAVRPTCATLFMA
jgi:two-component system, NarL family, invasion response regulator UvrY